ncbi:MAG: type I methionyl aminopeptidase [Opitutales bacterium]|jgi:methionyl aminopeptidase
MIALRSEMEIAEIREACRIAAEVLDRVCALVVPGVTTYDLDQAAKKFMAELGAESACYNYKVGSRRFPAYTCLSVNEEVVHGIGSLRRVLRAGDIIAVDIAVRHNGWIGDNARTVALSPVSADVQRLLETTEEALRAGIAQARASNRVGDIAHAIQTLVESRGLSVVREFVGHGVGRTMHEPPQVPNFGKPRTLEKLKPGMCIAIEPMVNLGGPEVEYAADQWTALTRDRRPSAHCEHTVLITGGAPEILTLPPARARA